MSIEQDVTEIEAARRFLKLLEVKDKFTLEMKKTSEGPGWPRWIMKETQP